MTDADREHARDMIGEEIGKIVDSLVDLLREGALTREGARTRLNHAVAQSSYTNDPVLMAQAAVYGDADTLRDTAHRALYVAAIMRLRRAAEYQQARP